MRRAMTFLALALVFLLSAAPASAAGRTFHFTFTGKGAEALWTTFPIDGEPQIGVVYTDTFLFASEEATSEDGTTTQNRFLFIDQFSFMFNRRGEFVFVSETFGSASGDSVSLSVNKSLTRASASAVVELTTCTEQRRNFVCEPAGTGEVSASWTGTGDLVRVNGNFHSNSKNFTFNEHFRGTFRDATATGSLDGAAFGSSLFADIFSVRDSFIDVSH